MEKRKVTILLSDRQDWSRQLVTGIVTRISEISANVIVPPTAELHDLVELATNREWHLGVLLVNNVSYPSADRSPVEVIRGSLELVQQFKQQHSQPLIVCYGFPDSADFPNELLAAGADAVFRLPFKSTEFQEAVRRCLNCTAPYPAIGSAEVGEQPRSLARSGSATFVPLVAAGALFLALVPRLPYGYFLLLRWVVCGASCLGALLAFGSDRRVWGWVMAATAVLFNPVFTVRAHRDTWQVVDLVVAVIFLFSIPIFRPNKSPH